MSIACWTSLKNRVTRKVDVQCVMFAMEAEVPCGQGILHLGITKFTKKLPWLPPRRSLRS